MTLPRPETAPRLGPLLLAYASLLAIAWADNARMPLFPDLLRELGLSDARGSLLFSGSSAGQVLGGLLGGWLLARRPARGVLGWALLVVAAGTALVARAPDLPLLLVGGALYGLGCGVVTTGQNLLVERACSGALRRRAFAGLHAMYALASLLAPLVAVAVREGHGGWRLALLAAGLPALALALLTPLARPVPPPATAPARGGAPGDLRGRLPARLRLGALVACYVVAELCLSTRLPLLFERAGASPELAATSLSAFFACLLVGRLLAGLVPLPLGNRPLLRLSAGLALALYLAGLLWEPWLLPLVALPMAPFFPLAMDLLAEELPHDVPGALGTVMALVSLALVLGQPLLGALSDAFGLRQALLLGPAALLAASLLLCRTQPITHSADRV